MMTRAWHPDAWAEPWTILPKEQPWIGNTYGPTRLGFVVLVKFFQPEGRFPRQPAEVPRGIVEYLAQQVDVGPETWEQYDWHGRSIEYHRAQIRQHVGFREASIADGESRRTWRCDQVLCTTPRVDPVREAFYQHCRENRLEPPTPERTERLLRSAFHPFEPQVSEQVFRQLLPATRQTLDAWWAADEAPVDAAQPAESSRADHAVLHELRADPGRASLENLLRAITNLERVRDLDLPLTLLSHLGPKVLQTYRQRVAVEAPYELRRHPEALRMSLLAVFCHCRRRELTDSLVDVLLELIHRIGARAERKVEKAFLEDLKRVNGKTGMLFRLAEAALAHPEGVVKEIVFPIVHEATWRDLVKEGQAPGPFSRYQVQTVIRRSYPLHDRRMLPPWLHALECRSNNARPQPLIEALALLKKDLPSSARTSPADEEVPFEGVVRDLWREVVLETDSQGHARVNRISYELCVLHMLRERLRCKEIWVVGADRYRNPDEDVPTDFVAQRQTYYTVL
jgi:hypothetical protein